MSKINFIAGPIGSSGEIAAVLLQSARNSELVFKFPPAISNSVVGLTIPGNSDHRTNLAASIANKETFDCDTQLSLIRQAISSHADCDQLFIGGIGVGLFADKLVNLYTQSNFYFTKCTIAENEALNTIKELGDRGFNLPPGSKAYIVQLNSQIRTAVNSAVSSLGLSWTSGNSKIKDVTTIPGEEKEETLPNTALNEIENFLHTKTLFLYPTELAVYIPRMTLNLDL